MSTMQSILFQAIEITDEEYEYFKVNNEKYFYTLSLQNSILNYCVLNYYFLKMRCKVFLFNRASCILNTLFLKGR